MMDIDEEVDLKKQTDERNAFRKSLVEEAKIEATEVRPPSVFAAVVILPSERR